MCYNLNFMISNRCSQSNDLNSMISNLWSQLLISILWSHFYDLNYMMTNLCSQSYDLSSRISILWFQDWSQTYYLNYMISNIWYLISTISFLRTQLYDINSMTMVIRCMSKYGMSSYHISSCQLICCTWRGALDTF